MKTDRFTYEGVPTPCYIIEEDLLRRNLELIRDVSRRAGVEIILAFKAFALWKSFPVFREYISHTTASSLYEARLAAEEFGSKAHTYSPAYTERDFDQILSCSSHVTFNSMSQYARFYPRVEEYNRLHEHKTRILRDSEEKPSLLSMWEDFSLRMARIGAQIIRYRAYYCRRLLAAAAAVYSDIAPHEALSGVYRTVSSVSDPFASAQQLERELIDHVFRHKNAEIAAKSCLSGPHKDDLELLLDGRSASAFASQGQVRTCTLSLKLAERELFFEEDGEYPVLLLDDVLSELDRRRQDFVLNRISAGQVMITCCEDGISEKLRAGAAFHIKNGKIV